MSFVKTPGTSKDRVEHKHEHIPRMNFVGATNQMELIRKKYDQSYFENILINRSSNSQRNRRRLKEILAHKRSGKLLEIGFGNGDFLRLTQGYFDVEGMDISKYAVSSIEGDLKEKVKQVDIEEEQLLSGRYDVIVAFNILEHLERPGKVIAKLFDSLREGGFFIGSVPFNAGFLGKVHTVLTNIFDTTHVSTYPPQRWLTLLERAGFRNIRVFGETLIGGRWIIYLKEGLCRPLWFNMMFSCER